MSFTISSVLQNGLNLTRIADSSTGIQVAVLQEHGAMLHEFSIPFEDRRIQVISSYRDLAELKKNGLLWYKSAKLSPFVCRLAEGRYAFKGKSYEFQNKFPDGHAIHGIISDKSFSEVRRKIRDHSASVEFRYDYHQEDPAFPFTYSINITYTLTDAGELMLRTVVQNNSAETIPMADGWHPYFQLEGFSNDWLLSFRSRSMLAFDKQLIPLGSLVAYKNFFSPELIANLSLDNCFLLEPNDGRPAATLENPATGLCLLVFADENYPYLQIYTPEDRKSIAIENLSAAPDAFNNYLGLLTLDPGSSQSFSARYQLQFR